MPSDQPRLPDAPHHPFAARGPAYGTYRGELTTLDLAPTARQVFGTLGTRRGIKRWQWFGVFDDGIAAGAAVVWLGYAANIFAWVFDREARRFVFERQANLPPWSVDVAATPRPGTVSKAGQKLQLARPTESTWRATADWRGLHIDVSGRQTAAPSTAICPVEGHPGALHTTRKGALVEASGRIEWQGGSHRLRDDAFILLDHSHGLPNRRTSWRWVMAQGHDQSGQTVALNAVSGFNDGLENVAWIDGEPAALGKVNIAFSPDRPDNAWSIYNDHLDLELAVEGVREHDVNLGLVASRYAQPIGVWRGELFGRQVTLSGVAEDHHAVW